MKSKTNFSTYTSGFMFWSIIIISYTQFFATQTYAQEQLMTKSISGSSVRWNITNGNVEFCNSLNCATPRTLPPPVPNDAELLMIPSGGLWIMTLDGRYQIHCSTEPNCVPPRTSLSKLPSGMKYKFSTTTDLKLLVTDPRTNTTLWCSNEPNCTP